MPFSFVITLLNALYEVLFFVLEVLLRVSTEKVADCCGDFSIKPVVQLFEYVTGYAEDESDDCA